MCLKFACPAAILAALVFVLPAFADDTTSALINQQLDKQIKITLNSLLPQAMEAIEKQTGVPMKADPAVWDLLPWGRDTNINATIQNQTLREALDAITRKLGLQYELKGDALLLEPIPALRRLARRSTVQELNALDAMGTLPLGKDGAMPLKALLDAVDAKLAAKSGFAIDRPAGDILGMDASVNIARNSTLLDAMEAMTKQTSATWYPWGKTIIVLSKPDQVRRQLERTISVRYNGVDLAQVLVELSQKAGVPFSIEPGAIQAVPPEARNIRLVLDDYSIQDALREIGGFTGLDYMIKDTNVYLWNSSSSITHRDPVMIIMNIRGTDMQLLVPTSQVPADIQEYCKNKLQLEFKSVRDMMKEEGYHAATQPAVPATKPVVKDQDL